MAAGARPTLFFISEKWCGKACPSTACTALSSSLEPSAKRNAKALFLHGLRNNNPSVTSELNAVDAGVEDRCAT
jgi:hypothetical protein